MRPSLERVKQLVRYEPDTGLFIRLSAPGDRVDLVGKIGGGPTSDGYFRIAIDNYRVRSHRLAFFYMTGRWPKEEIDHINGDRTDNRWANLRESSSAMNKENRRNANRNSKTGFLGVRPVNGGSQFQARIGVRGKTITVGSFRTAEDAHVAYLSAKRKLHEGCAI